MKEKNAYFSSLSPVLAFSILARLAKSAGRVTDAKIAKPARRKPSIDAEIVVPISDQEIITSTTAGTSEDSSTNPL
ncbi:MAG: hypothetical protein JJ899_12905 [Alphaproteobacteria bacterium]|nr:hypothetical protein [Alphaproteobacteria bacterium]